MHIYMRHIENKYLEKHFFTNMGLFKYLILNRLEETLPHR